MSILEVISLPSHLIIATFMPRRNRIEISSFLPPDLYEYCLNHEKKHAEIFSKYGLYTWRHFKLDIQDRWYIYTHPEILHKLFDDGLHRTTKEKLKDLPYMIIYNLFGGFTQLFIIATSAILLRRQLTKISEAIAYEL